MLDVDGIRVSRARWLYSLMLLFKIKGFECWCDKLWISVSGEVITDYATTGFKKVWCLEGCGIVRFGLPWLN